MAKSVKDTEFVIKLENIKLSAAATKRIESGIQSLVLQELAAYKPNPDGPDRPGPVFPGGPIIIIPPRPWPGLILKKLLPAEVDKLNLGKLTNILGK